MSDEKRVRERAVEAMASVTVSVGDVALNGTMLLDDEDLLRLIDAMEEAGLRIVE